MNVPDYKRERISELLDLGISLMKEAKKIVEENDRKAEEFDSKFKKRIEEHREKAKRIAEENDRKAEEFERKFQKTEEEMEAFRKKYFPDD